MSIAPRAAHDDVVVTTTRTPRRILVDRVDQDVGVDKDHFRSSSLRAIYDAIVATNSQQVLTTIVRVRYGEPSGMLAVASVTARSTSR